MSEEPADTGVLEDATTPKEGEVAAVKEDVAPPEQAAPEQAKDVDKMESQTKSVLDHSLTRNKQDKRAKPFVIAVAITAALGGMIFGYDVGGAGESVICNMHHSHAQYAHSLPICPTLNL